MSTPAMRRFFSTWKRWPRSGWNGWRISAHPKGELCSSAVRVDRPDGAGSIYPASGDAGSAAAVGSTFSATAMVFDRDDQLIKR